RLARPARAQIRIRLETKLRHYTSAAFRRKSAVNSLPPVCAQGRAKRCLGIKLRYIHNPNLLFECLKSIRTVEGWNRTHSLASRAHLRFHPTRAMHNSQFDGSGGTSRTHINIRRKRFSSVE